VRTQWTLGLAPLGREFRSFKWSFPFFNELSSLRKRLSLTKAVGTPRARTAPPTRHDDEDTDNLTGNPFGTTTALAAWERVWDATVVGFKLAGVLVKRLGSDGVGGGCWRERVWEATVVDVKLAGVLFKRLGSDGVGVGCWRERVRFETGALAPIWSS